MGFKACERHRVMDGVSKELAEEAGAQEEHSRR